MADVIPYPHFNPVAIQIGKFAIHWYGIMYLLAFWAEYMMLKVQNKRLKLNLEDADLSDFVGHVIFGVVIGGRLGYILIYNPMQYLKDPLEIFAVWHGGMSFHGGLVGTIVAGWFWCRKRGVSFTSMADAAILGVPIGLALGRFGNFINGELWGKVTNVPWAMVFPTGGPEPRHPSQLYELGLEGFGLFGLLWFLSLRKTPKGVLFFVFLAGYGAIRFFIEIFRSPDQQFLSDTNPSGAILGMLSMGQILSLPMIAIGMAMTVRAYMMVPKAPVAIAASEAEAEPTAAPPAA